MSVEGTNTPNGVSNGKSENGIALNYTTVKPGYDYTNWNKPGDALEADGSYVVVVGDAVRDGDSITIAATFIGEQAKRSEVKESVKKFKQEYIAALKRKGVKVLTAEEYAKFKDEVLHDKNGNGIDDRKEEQEQDAK